MIPSVHVLGSLNVDIVARVQELPLPGETVHSQFSSRGAGGKGSNQAVAAARAGSKTYMSGVVGVDDDGEFLVQRLNSEGIETISVRKDGTSHTGRANITVQNDGQNQIVLMAGANSSLADEDAERSAHAFKEGDILLLQLETPVSAAEKAALLAQERGAKVILNAAPACPLPNSLLNYIDIIIVNETELQSLAGTSEDILENARRIAIRDDIIVVVTLGEKGAIVATKNSGKSFATPRVTAVDTTGAGDAFVGYFASGLSRGYELDKAISVAVIAGAMAVQKHGAQGSIPHQHEVSAIRKSLQSPKQTMEPIKANHKLHLE